MNKILTDGAEHTDDKYKTVNTKVFVDDDECCLCRCKLYCSLGGGSRDIISSSWLVGPVASLRPRGVATVRPATRPLWRGASVEAPSWRGYVLSCVPRTATRSVLLALLSPTGSVGRQHRHALAAWRGPDQWRASLLITAERQRRRALVALR